VKAPKRLASWLNRVTSWAELGAHIWARYWLLIIGSCLVFGSVILKWVQFPFSHDVSGLKFSFLHDPGVTPHFALFSAGIMGLGVLVVGIFFLKRYPPVLGLAAAILIMLWAITPAQIAFRQPSMLRRLTYELQVNPILNIFTKYYLLQNYGSPELVPKRLVLYSAWGRFVAAWSFLRLGWYCFGLGALLIGVYAIAQMPSGRLTRVLSLLCLPIGALAIILIPPTVAQHYYVLGTLAATFGHNQEAIDDYRKAMRWDSWHANDIDLYAAIGQLQKLGTLIQRNPKATFSVEGYTDSFGAFEYNLDLSQRRADSVKRYLVQAMGINPAQVQTRGYGATKFRSSANGSIEEQSANRRVEVVVRTTEG